MRSWFRFKQVSDYKSINQEICTSARGPLNTAAPGLSVSLFLSGMYHMPGVYTG